MPRFIREFIAEDVQEVDYVLERMKKDFTFSEEIRDVMIPELNSKVSEN